MKTGGLVLLKAKIVTLNILLQHVTQAIAYAANCARLVEYCT
jgi:hypothetical protein